MRVFDARFFGLGIGLVLWGLWARNATLVVVGVIIIGALWAFRRWLRNGDARSVLAAAHPGSTADVVVGPMGETVGTLSGIPADQAPTVVEDTWFRLRASYPSKNRLAVVVRDTDGQYWGTDWVRMSPPNSPLEYWGEATAGNEFVDAAVKLGSIVKGADGRLYKLSPVAPWGPLSAPAAVGYGLTEPGSQSESDPATTVPGPESAAVSVSSGRGIWSTIQEVFRARR